MTMTNSILEILQSGADVTLNVKSSDLKEFGRYLIDTTTEEVKERVKSGEEDVLLTVEEVMSKLGIKDRTTLWRWQKKKYLLPIKAGKRVLYRQCDIDRVLTIKGYAI